MSRDHVRSILRIVFVLVLLVSSTACANKNDSYRLPESLEKQVQVYESADAEAPPDSGQVLFIGSSSIRMWKTLERDMAPLPVLNRGFGGSRTADVLAVMDRIVLPYQPSVIVYYCGDNDLGSSNTDIKTPAANFITFVEQVHRAQPGKPILYIAIKPSIRRWQNWVNMREANELVRSYCEDHDDLTYLDIVPTLIGDNGEPDPQRFISDGLHMNEQGYAAWTELIRPCVLEAWEQAHSEESGNDSEVKDSAHDPNADKEH